MKTRNTLRRKRQGEKDSEKRQKLCDEILDLGSKIKYLKQELTYCEKIKEQTQMIKTNLKEIEQKENEKENEKIRKGEIEK